MRIVEAKNSLARSVGRWTPFLIFVFMSGWMILFRPLNSAVTFSVIDDGMYYQRIAQNIFSKGLCTYDGVTITNGFHPLWLLSLLPLYATVHDPFLALRLVFVFVFLILSVCFLLLDRISKLLNFSSGGIYAICFIVLLNLRSFTLFYGLLESHLALLSYLLYIVYALRVAEKKFSQPYYAFINGLLIGICFLARLDSFILAIAFGLTLLWRATVTNKAWIVSLKTVTASAIGCLILVVPYLSLNFYYFGHLNTVSAYMKARPPGTDSVGIMWHWFYSQTIPRFKYALGIDMIPSAVVATAMLGVLTLGLVYIAFLIRKESRQERLVPVADFLSFAVLHFAFICLVAPDEAIASIWYLVPEILTVGLLVGFSIPDIRLWHIRPIPILIGLLLLAQVWIYPSFLKRKLMTLAKIEVADYMRNNVPKETRGCMFDSGIVSYFSQRDFVGLNGLIGDYELANMVRKGERSTIVRKYDIDILVLDTPKHLLPVLSREIVWMSTIESKFTNFQEAAKPFVIYNISPTSIDTIWNTRYGLEEIAE